MISTLSFVKNVWRATLLALLFPLVQGCVFDPQQLFVQPPPPQNTKELCQAKCKPSKTLQPCDTLCQQRIKSCIQTCIHKNNPGCISTKVCPTFNPEEDCYYPCRQKGLSPAVCKKNMYTFQECTKKTQSTEKCKRVCFQ